MKSRIVPVPGLAVHVLHKAVGFTSPDSYPVDLFDLQYDSVTEVIESTDKGWGQWNGCRHRKYSVEVNRANVIYPASRYGSDMTGKHWTLASMGCNRVLAGYVTSDNITQYPVASATSDIDLSSVNINDLVGRSLNAMLPGIRPRLSVPNALYELKDFRSLPRTLMRLEQVVTAMRKLLKVDASRTLWQTMYSLKKLIGGSSDTYLQLQFNILPLTRDICSLYMAVVNTKQQIDSLLRNEGKTQVRHFSQSLGGVFVDSDEEDTYGPTGVAPQFAGTTFSWGRKTTYPSSMFHAELQYSYTIADLDRQYAGVLGVLDSLGVNLNPQIIWNAIPWSFVVDWVFGVSRWLGKYKVRNLEPVTKLHRYLYSVKVERECETWYRRNMSAATDTGKVWQVRTKYLVYDRVPYVPLDMRTVELSGIDLNEFILSSALIGSRLR